MSAALVSFSGIPPIETSKCPVLNCEPGFFRSYEKLKNGFSWLCTSCPKNHFKPDVGNHKCKACHGRLSISNAARTACIDPYKNVYIGYKGNEFYILDSFSLIAFATTIVTLTIFVIKRNTPIVMTTDFKVAILHMSLHAFTFIVAPFSIFSHGFCFARPLLFTNVYTLNIGIVFVKSQKILQAFLSKVRITAGEAKRTMVTQVFTIGIFLLSVNVILLVSYYRDPAALLEFEDATNLTREQVCNTYFHNTMVMVGIAVIQLMCALQAFRGRNLPSIMNNGQVLMYTTFIMTASFAVCFIIVPFQKPIEKEVTQFVALLVNTLIIMFLLYGQKACRMIFYPKKNTRVYFHNHRMRWLKQEANQRLKSK